jgi:MFS family permease
MAACVDIIWRAMGPVGKRDDFRRLWLAATGSSLGTCITLIALPLVAVNTLDASPWQIGALQIATTAPSFVVGLVAGAWVDRLRRRPVMIAADLIRAVTLASVPLAAWIGLLTMSWLIVAAALLALASLFFDVADRSMLPSLVGRDEIVDANRMITAGLTVSEAGGFAIGGWLVHLLSGPAALLVDAISFIWSAAILRRIETPEPPPSPIEDRRPILHEIHAGLRLVLSVPLLRTLAATLVFASIGRQIIGVVFMIYVSRDLGFSAGVLGLIFATGGFFSLLGSVTSNRVTARFGIGPMLAAALLAIFAANGSMTLATGPTILGAVFLIVQQVGDYGATLYEMGEVSLRQAVTDDAWQGRMHGTFRVLEFGGYLTGALIGGALGESLGARATILIGASAYIIAAWPIVFSQVRGLRTVNEVVSSR